MTLAPAQVETVKRLTRGMPPKAFVFRTPTGKAWRHANFYNRKRKPGDAMHALSLDSDIGSAVQAAMIGSPSRVPRSAIGQRLN